MSKRAGTATTAPSRAAAPTMPTPPAASLSPTPRSSTKPLTRILPPQTQTQTQRPGDRGTVSSKKRRRDSAPPTTSKRVATPADVDAPFRAKKGHGLADGPGGARKVDTVAGLATPPGKKSSREPSNMPHQPMHPERGTPRAATAQKAAPRLVETPVPAPNVHAIMRSLREARQAAAPSGHSPGAPAAAAAASKQDTAPATVAKQEAPPPRSAKKKASSSKATPPKATPKTSEAGASAAMSTKPTKPKKSSSKKAPAAAPQTETPEADTTTTTTPASARLPTPSSSSRGASPLDAPQEPPVGYRGDMGVSPALIFPARILPAGRHTAGLPPALPDSEPGRQHEDPARGPAAARRRGTNQLAPLQTSSLAADWMASAGSELAYDPHMTVFPTAAAAPGSNPSGGHGRPPPLSPASTRLARPASSHPPKMRRGNATYGEGSLTAKQIIERALKPPAVEPLSPVRHKFEDMMLRMAPPSPTHHGGRWETAGVLEMARWG